MRLTYDATGRKWSKDGEFGVTSYASGIEYHDGKLEAIYAPDGRMVAEYTNGQITRYRAEYFHQDHLGNTRLGFSDFNQNGRVDLEEEDPNTPLNELEITQESHYYPFGMNHLGPWYKTIAPENKYLYNGKELSEDYGIKLYEYGWRWYDGAIGRWTAVDPSSEEYHPFSPFSYAANNPVLFIDPDGRKIRVADLITNKDGGVSLEGLLGLVGIMESLSQITGLKVTFENGYLVEGEETAGKKSEEFTTGSPSARKYFRSLVQDAETINVTNATGKLGVDPRTPNGIGIDVAQMFAFENAASAAGLPDLTWSSGMTFLHETLHTKIGHKVKGKKFGYYDHRRDGSRDYKPGRTVDVINHFRIQLDLPIRNNYGISNAVPYIFFGDSKVRVYSSEIEAHKKKWEKVFKSIIPAERALNQK